MNRDIVLNPDIGKMNPDSVRYKLYMGLYNYFYSVQNPKTEDFPNGIESGDQLDIRLKNTSYAMAQVIGDSIIFGSTGGGEIDITELLNKTGDSMSGELSALFGFRAGVDGSVAVSVSSESGVKYINVEDKISIPFDGLIIGDKNIIHRDIDNRTTIIEDDSIHIKSNDVKIDGKADVGGVLVDNGTIISKDGNEFYHSGNSNKGDVDWSANNISASGDITVGGLATIDGRAKFNNGISVFEDDINILSTSSDSIDINGNTNISGNVFVDKRSVIRGVESGTVIESSSGILHLGSASTNQLRLMNDIRSWNGSYNIITKGGFGNFVDGISVSHNYSSPLMKSYHIGDDLGIIFTKKIRFNDEKGVYLQPNGNGLGIGIGAGELYIHRLLSDSLYKPSGSDSYTSYFGTNDDFISFLKPIESDSFTIKGKRTRISDGLIDFGNNLMIESDRNKIIIHGYTQFTNNVSSPQFVGGYNGRGWAIRRDSITGLSDMTVDEMTVRGRLSIYELDVQMTRGSNGAIWVSDGFKADIVEHII